MQRSLAVMERLKGAGTWLDLFQTASLKIRALEFCYLAIDNEYDAPLHFQLTRIFSLSFLRSLSSLVLEPTNVRHFSDYFNTLSPPRAGKPQACFQLPLLSSLTIKDYSMDDHFYYRLMEQVYTDPGRLAVYELLPFCPNIDTLRFSTFVTDPESFDVFDFDQLPRTLRSVHIDFTCHFIDYSRAQIYGLFWSLSRWLRSADATQSLHSLSLGIDWDEIEGEVVNNEREAYRDRQYAVTRSALDSLIDVAKQQDDSRFLRYPWDPKSEPLEHTLEAIGHLLDYAILVQEDVPKIMRGLYAEVKAIRALLDSRGIAYRFDLPEEAGS
jgi:hypothetical protein